MNILSIDLDILMRGCNKYQKYIDLELTPEQSWQVIEWKTGKKEYPLDKKCLSFIIDVLSKKCKKAESYIIDDHDEIIDILKMYPKHSFVTNFDFHSDISYGNDDTELTIENWVKHARNDDLINQYLWVCQDSSEVSPYNTFNYSRSSWKDLDVDSLPNYDVVVFCISHHFLPPKYWSMAQDLREYLCNFVQNDFVLCDDPQIDESQYPDYDGWMTDVVVKKEAWYKYYDYYVQAELIDNVVWLSIISLGSKKNILAPCHRLLEGILKHYNVGFTWTKGYKSESLIKRLIKSHKIISKGCVNNKNKVILNKEDN